MDKNYHPQVMRLIKFAFLLCGLVLSLTTVASELVPFRADYTAYRHGSDLGDAYMQLESLGRNRYRLEYQSHVSLFFLSDKRTEVSLFEISDGKIQPYKYHYSREGTGSDKELEARFNKANDQITLDNGETLVWQGALDNQLYRLDLQKQLAAGQTQFEYRMLNYRGQLRDYTLEVVGKEQLELPYGMLEGIKVRIVRDSARRETFAWFAPSLNYQLVRLQQFKDGDEQGDIQLRSYTTSPAR
ncbi:DUF3108 domain-containing protein [Aestuariibacter halophilus]|uniref:DUF3108 domain-containing protein n=1 Tax=Fluctibacter halophilus TaxID=226011 RepID=A0ABS8G4Z1_9ALTE|nr:DUF3108 domain-containing protein [Aestuariibacter halophilus]MCC2615563.1 DUF3108 domain-containing protein [Aestuariibacter halophilus]